MGPRIHPFLAANVVVDGLAHRHEIKRPKMSILVEKHFNYNLILNNWDPCFTHIRLLVRIVNGLVHSHKIKTLCMSMVVYKQFNNTFTRPTAYNITAPVTHVKLFTA